MRRSKPLPNYAYSCPHLQRNDARLNCRCADQVTFNHFTLLTDPANVTEFPTTINDTRVMILPNIQQHGEPYVI